MLFKLINALVIYQRQNENILRKNFKKFVIYYLDDILIYSKNNKDYEVHIKWVLSKFFEVNLIFKLSKCEFNIKKILYLKYIILLKEIRIDSEKLEIIKN